MPWTVHWAMHYWPAIEWVWVGPDFAGSGYADLTRKWWLEGEPFIVVEHDVVPWPGAIEALIECPEPWCAHSHHHDHAFLRHGSVEMSCYKVVPAELGSDPFPAEVPWQQTDSVLSQKLFERGHMIHQHWPSVANLNGDYSVNPRPIREQVFEQAVR